MSGQSFISKPGKVLDEIDFNRKTENQLKTSHAQTPNYPSQIKFFDHQGNLIVKEDEMGYSSERVSSTTKAKGFSQNAKDYVPCLFLPCLKGSNKLIIFFHGNAEDLGISYEMLDHMRTALRMNIMAVEYPGYGIYLDPEGPSEDKVYRDAELVYNFV